MYARYVPSGSADCAVFVCPSHEVSLKETCCYPRAPFAAAQIPRLGKMIRLRVAAARSLMNWLLNHLAVAVPLERVRLEADGESAQLTCLLAPHDGANGTVLRKSGETHAPTSTLPAVWHDNDDHHVAGCQKLPVSNP